MIVITVARRPLAASTVAGNCLSFGTGALNIDTSRVAAPGEVVETHSRSPEASTGRPVYGEYGPMETHATPGQALGRWPANLVLGHLSGCVSQGTARVQSSSGFTAPHVRRNVPRTHVYGYGDFNGSQPTCYVNEDGTETVAVWDCAPGCPVASLNEQTTSDTAVGASRFFKVVQSGKENT